MRRLPKPVVAMVAGYAIGGGHVLHVCCDLTIAADNARFGQTGPRVGSWDGGFGASLLRDLVGTKKAKEFWLLCRQYDAEEALEMGLVNAVVPVDELERETVAWCREMLALSPFALRLVKASFNAHEDGYAGIQQLAHDANLLFYGSEEAREGREAFKEKRQPDFSQVPRGGHEDLADGGAAADAAGGDRAGVRGDRGRGRMAGRLPRVGAFVAALVGSIFIQIGTNLANDYSDAKRGADTADRLGPVRVTSAGLVTPQRVLRATWVAFAVAVACGIYLADRRRDRDPPDRRRLDRRRRPLHRRPAALRLRRPRRGLRLPLLRPGRRQRLLLRPGRAARRAAARGSRSRSASSRPRSSSSTTSATWRPTGAPAR